MNFVEYAKSANHCQRNWADKEIEQEKIDELIQVATNMPTKQNQEFYKLVVSANKDYNDFVHLNGYDRNNPKVMERSFEKRHLTNQNTQLQAPLLFQWVVDGGNEFLDAASRTPNNELYNGVAHMCVGISSGAVALAAAAMGLKTGFCVCVDVPNVLDRLKSISNITATDIFITLGIGYPRPRVPHNMFFRSGQFPRLKETYKKNIKVYSL